MNMIWKTHFQKGKNFKLINSFAFAFGINVYKLDNIKDKEEKEKYMIDNMIKSINENLLNFQ